MKLLRLLAIAAGLISAQSNPSWWKYTPPESTAIVGIQWKTMRNTLFSSAVAAEMAPGGSLRFPNLELVRNPEQILIGGPEMLALESGMFPLNKLREQAAAQGMRRSSYKSTELWISPESDVHSVAYIHDRLILIGTVQSLHDAIERIADPKNKAYSPLLARGARYSKEDLWVVASELPDPLASLFVPFDIEATAFEGSVSAWSGLHAVAAIERDSPNKALDLADSLAETLASRPAMAEGTEITTKDRTVLIRMDLDEGQLAQSLRSPGAPATVAVAAVGEAHAVPAVVAAEPPAAASKAPPKAFVAPVVSNSLQPASSTSPSVVQSLDIPEISVSAPDQQAPPRAQLPPAPPKPRVVKIFGLEAGPKEITLPK